jgi:hypothetical protein
MRTIETPFQFIFQSRDDNGLFELRIQKDCSQLQLSSGMDGFGNSVYINIDKSELIVLKDMITKVLNGSNQIFKTL